MTHLVVGRPKAERIFDRRSEVQATKGLVVHAAEAYIEALEAENPNEQTIAEELSALRGAVLVLRAVR